MSPPAIATVITKSRLAHARVLARSLHRHHPDLRLVVLLCDEIEGCFDPEAEPFDVLPVADVGIPQPGRFLLVRDRMQATSALKPFLLEHLLGAGSAGVLYLDSDVQVLGDLGPVFARVRSHAAVLTPHLLEPAPHEDIDRELSVLQAGVHNAGVVGVSATAPAQELLEWWRTRLLEHCRQDLAGGMHYDQRWLDLAPSMFEDVHLLRDPGCNVGHWNLPERRIEVRGDEVLVNGGPCRLFHFSGYDPERPDVVNRYYPDRLPMARIGDGAQLFRGYAQELDAAGYREATTLGYAFERFANGVPVPGIARELYDADPTLRERFPDPFACGPDGGLFDWLNEPVDDAHPAVSRLWAAIYARRPDVRQAFPDHLGADRERFSSWTATSGHAEHEVPDRFP